MTTSRSIIPNERIERQIYFLRGEKVLLSSDLAKLYQVEPRALVQAVKRNRERFPDDFMFQLSADEFKNLKSQIVTSSWGGSRRARPYAFTEQGVAMLSSILRSRRAVQVNIEIMRAFVRLRRILGSNEELARKLATLESKYDSQFKIVFDAIRQLMAPPPSKKRPIGFSWVHSSVADHIRDIAGTRHPSPVSVPQGKLVITHDHPLSLEHTYTAVSDLCAFTRTVPYCRNALGGRPSCRL